MAISHGFIISLQTISQAFRDRNMAVLRSELGCLCFKLGVRYFWRCGGICLNKGCNIKDSIQNYRKNVEEVGVFSFVFGGWKGHEKVKGDVMTDQLKDFSGL